MSWVPGSLEGLARACSTYSESMCLMFRNCGSFDYPMSNIIAVQHKMNIKRRGGCASKFLYNACGFVSEAPVA
jgi:hypothetical protein